MHPIHRWNVEVIVYAGNEPVSAHEVLRTVQAHATIVTADSRVFRGTGRARLSDSSTNSRDLGAEVATARALSDVVQQLYDEALLDVQMLAETSRRPLRRIPGEYARQ